MGDVDGPAVAETVYKALFANESTNVLDQDAVAYGLDDAVHAMRRKGLHFSRWGTYVHLGV